MTVRPFELRDMLILNRYRDQGIFLDTIPTLTWGRVLIPMGAMLSPLSDTTGVITSLAFEDGDRRNPLVGQVAHIRNLPFARFSFLAPESAIESTALPALLENLVQRVGERQARSLVAEVEESTYTFEALRKAGFSIYSRQRIWKITSVPKMDRGETPWRRPKSEDEFAIHALYNNLVPALVQQVEPPYWDDKSGYVFYQEGELLAFVDVVSGPRGIWLQPFFHPETDQVAERLIDLLHILKPSAKRPVYIGLRSHASWLEASLENLDVEVGPRQAVMVKRLAAGVKEFKTAPLPEIAAASTPKATMPYTKPYLQHEKEFLLRQ
ncbi:MAG: hypothetical protein DWQ07_09730 [Chloroflexi bacterium]|nr:MAG: hypothetical protein DWQ07_09730 [Chloroflexota bacterium]MBL1193007.1 hypothetical protein [Chloroflexota bacterium]NOH10300.1 hypothetical protein [Chloroflexota bacterium]